MSKVIFFMKFSTKKFLRKGGSKRCGAAREIGGRAEEKKKKKEEKKKSIRDEKLTLDKVIFYAR